MQGSRDLIILLMCCILTVEQCNKAHSWLNLKIYQALDKLLLNTILSIIFSSDIYYVPVESRNASGESDISENAQKTALEEIEQ